jgi:hypothetical protein
LWREAVADQISGYPGPWSRSRVPRLLAADRGLAALQALLTGATLAVKSDGKDLAKKTWQKRRPGKEDLANGHAGQ